MNEIKILLALAFKFFVIGLLSFGGGMASIAILYEMIVQEEAWLNSSSFMDLLTLSQMTPGPIAINAATFVGIHVGGYPGAILATLASVLAPFLSVLFLAWLYKKYKHLDWLQKSLKGLRICSLFLLAQASFVILNHTLENFKTHFLDQIFALLLFVVLYTLKIKYKLGMLSILICSGVCFLCFKYFLMY